MSADEAAGAVIEDPQAGGVPKLSAEMSVAEARDAIAGFTRCQGELEDVAEVRDVELSGADGPLPGRLYHPAPGSQAGLLVSFHGGGWVGGDLEVADTPNRALANATGCAVLSVGYRLAPETPFPGPAEDCYAATKWARGAAAELGADPGRIEVIGDGAGGNLAAAVALMARDRGEEMIAHQTLIYPLMAPNHLRNIASDLPFASYAIYGLGGTIERPTIEWLWNQYLTNPKDSFNPYACPYRADDLAGLPPATVLLAGADPLRDEGKNYADRLADAGVPVAIHEYPGMFHGALWMAGLYDDSRRMFADIGDEVRPRLGSQAADVNPRQA